MIDGLLMAIATYSRIPTPRIEWTRQGLRYSLCFFPLVGVFVGALELGWLILASHFSLGAMLTGAVGCAVPLLVTGGIHMDGFMDALDALGARREREDTLRILKDPHAGAFAVMGCALYLIAQFSALPSLTFYPAVALAAGFVVSRAASAFLMAALPAARPDGMAAAVKDAAEEKGAAAVMLASIGWGTAFSVLMLWAAPVLSAVALLWVALSVLFCLRIVRRLGGITGDIAGWFLQVAELGILMTLAIGGCFL